MADSLRISPCNLCPRMCGARRAEGQRGVCGADSSIVVARAALHFWEEPVISGESGSGTIFFSYCPLRCIYCQNAMIARGEAGVSVSVERLSQLCLDLQEQGALNINFVTPTHYSLQIRDAVHRARSLGLQLPIVWNTSGYERVETVCALADTVDVYLTDFKYVDAALAAAYSHAPDYESVALAALDEMVRTHGKAAYDEYAGQPRMVRGVIVRHLLLPGALEQSKRTVQLLFERYGDAVSYSLMNQYTPLLATRAAAGDAYAQAALESFSELGTAVPLEEYEELLDFADSLGMQDYFWQDGPAAQESFIPAWDME